MLCALCAHAYIPTIYYAVFGIFSQLSEFVNIDLTITGYNGRSVTASPRLKINAAYAKKRINLKIDIQTVNFVTSRSQSTDTKEVDFVLAKSWSYK